MKWNNWHANLFGLSSNYVRYILDLSFAWQKSQYIMTRIIQLSHNLTKHIRTRALFDFKVTTRYIDHRIGPVKFRQTSSFDGGTHNYNLKLRILLDPLLRPGNQNLHVFVPFVNFVKHQDLLAANTNASQLTN